MWSPKGYGDSQGWYAPVSGGGLPTLTYIGNFSTSGNNPSTATAVSIGTASATRRVIIVVAHTQTGVTPSSGTLQGSIPFDVMSGAASGVASNVAIFSAVVPTGTTADVSLTWSTSNFSIAHCWVYTIDSSTLISQSPTRTVGTQAAGTSVNVTANIPASAAVIVGFASAGITNGTQAIGTNDIGVTRDQTFGSADVYHKNNPSANASAVTSISWTTSGNAALVVLSWK